MTRIASSAIVILAVVLTFLGGGVIFAQDKYTVQVPGGLAFSEFRGYEDWPVIAISENGGKIAVILGNSTMIDAYKTGGAKMAKIHWIPKRQDAYLGQPTVPGTQHDADFMVKDSNSFADSGGWGWGAFEYDPASDTFSPATEAANPPQGHDAKCGFACHTLVKNRDYVFTEYGRR